MRAPQASVHDVPKYQPLAIVGLSFRFPGGATNSEKFWTMMEEKRCAMTEIPKDRLAVDAFYNKQRERPDTVWKNA
jgi:acyl transferase domain-containing protein